MWKQTILYLHADEYPQSWEVLRTELDMPAPRIILQSNLITPSEAVDPFRFQMYVTQRGIALAFEYTKIVKESWPDEYFDQIEFMGLDEAPQFYPDFNLYRHLFKESANDNTEPSPNPNPLP